MDSSQLTPGVLWLRQLISGFIHEWEEAIHTQISLIPPTLLQVCCGWGSSSLGSFMNGRKPYIHRSHWFLPPYSRCVVAEAAHLWVHSWMGGSHTYTDLIDSSHPTPGVLWLRQLISGFIHEWEEAIHTQISLIPPKLLQVCCGWGTSSLGSFINGMRPHIHRSHLFLPPYSRCVVAEAAHLWVHSWMGGSHTYTDIIDSSHPTPGVLWLRHLISGFIHKWEEAIHTQILLIPPTLLQVCCD